MRIQSIVLWKEVDIFYIKVIEYIMFLLTLHKNMIL